MKRGIRTLTGAAVLTTAALLLSVGHAQADDVAAPPPLDLKVANIVPTAVEQPAPRYPAIARAANLTGQVKLKIIVDLDGTVESVHVVKSQPPFDEPAVAAVKRWRYEPVVIDGSPRRWQGTITLNFTLRDNDAAPPAPPSVETCGTDSDEALIAGLGEAFWRDGKLQPPEAIRQRAPFYPAVARKENIQGQVILEIKVRPDGSVGDVCVYESDPPFDSRALDAVRTWRYRPVFDKGIAIAWRSLITLNFRLKGDRWNGTSVADADDATRAYLEMASAMPDRRLPSFRQAYVSWSRAANGNKKSAELARRMKEAVRRAERQLRGLPRDSKHDRGEVPAKPPKRVLAPWARELLLGEAGPPAPPEPLATDATARVEVSVDALGTVTDARIIDASDPAIMSWALASASVTRFKPLRRWFHRVPFREVLEFHWAPSVLRSPTPTALPVVTETTPTTSDTAPSAEPRTPAP